MEKINLNKVNYIQYGNAKGKDIILLHGWGQNIEMMEPLGNPLSSKYHITILDFPGYGKSAEPDEVWGVSDYAKLVHELVKKLKIKKPTLIGHSFGGRVAIVYASMYEVDRVILFGAPCVRTKKGLTLKEKMLKKAKALPGMGKIAEIAKNYIGSEDYKNATPRMREILVKTVNEDLSDYAKKITAPTLLIWGEYDEAAPLEEAKLLEGLLTDGALIVLPGTHYAYLENLSRVINIINNFMEG